MEFVTPQVGNALKVRGNEKVHTTAPSELQTAAKRWKGCVGIRVNSALGLIQAPGITTLETQRVV